MSKVYFISDLHFGHDRIREFDKKNTNMRGGECSDTHDEWLIEEFNKVVRKRDTTWFLGDIAMGRPGGKGWDTLSKVKRLNGNKKLILGNHDDMPIEAYQKYFSYIRGFCKYKRHWLSHAPIHSFEMRGSPNIHGHTHSVEMEVVNDFGVLTPDPRYLNVCVEANMKYHGTPVVEFSELMARFPK